MSPASERDAFVRAIIAEPDDDAPRLVFADWLDENGESERAEFIRVQVALAQLAEGESDVDRRSRERTLLQRHAATWLAELPTLAGVKPEGFHRGFIQQVTFANLKAFRLHAATVSQHPVRAVTFRTLTPGTTRSLANMAELTHVRSLSLRRSGADAASLAELFRSPHLVGLRRLALEKSPIDLEVMEAIGRHLVRLEVLSVASSGVSDEHLAVSARLAAMPHLRELNLSNNELADAGVVALADARGLPALARLSLNYNNVGDAGVVALARSSHREALRILDLYQNSVGGEGMAALAAWTSLESVGLRPNSLASLPTTERPPAIGSPAGQRTLKLWAGELDDESLAALIRYPGFETITTLNLSSNPLTEDSLRTLADVPVPIALQHFTLFTSVKASVVEMLLLSTRLGCLESLCLWPDEPGDGEPVHELPAGSVWSKVALRVYGNRSALAWLARSASLRRVRELTVGAAEWPALIPSPHLSELEELSATYTKPVQIRALVAATHLRQLKRLILGYGKQGDVKARLLADTPHLASLETLEMVDDAVGDAGALALAASPHLGGLQRLNLRRNAICTDAVRRLRERFGERVLLSEPEGTS